MVVTSRLITTVFIVLFFSIKASVSLAAILPEQRADALWHSYDGGGVTIDGPSVLVRKNVGDKFSFSGNYYIDMVTSASVDVLATASAYTEERKEYSLGMDYLNDRTIMSFGYANSTESDYIADTVSYTISQEFFGDLSTLTMGFALGDDTVKATGAPDFEASTNRRRYNLGFSQILTKRFIASASYEAVFDEGFLRNPYRAARAFDADNSAKRDNYLDGNLDEDGNQLCVGQENNTIGGECYPETRNSEAFAIRGIYAFTNHSSLRAEYRQYEDSWDVESQNFELRYSHQIKDRWLLELRGRVYEQSSGAFFYRDTINLSAERPRFYGRDKEISEYSSVQYGLSLSYTFKSRHEFFNNSTLNFSWDHMIFDYDNFRDSSNDNFAVGEEPLYSLEADVFRLFYSAFF
ncbi:MAG: DUF3570 domain-containing protein [Cellvibrionaceae bacterium]